MNCRDFQNEFEERAPLSRAAALHLDSCANCRTLHFKQTKLWEMLGALERVEAPADFNFQLKARMARAEPSDYQTGFFPALRYALPAGFIVVLISFVALSGLYFVDRDSVAGNDLPNREVNSALPVNSFLPPKEIAGKNLPSNEEAPTVKEPANKPPEIDNNKERAAQNKRGGSRDLPTKRPDVISPGTKDEAGDLRDRDIAGTNPGVITPPGIDPNQEVKSTVNSNAVTETSIKDLLEIAGIKTESLKVVSVIKNSVGERSGVKIGDTIEAINGKKITGDALRGKQIEEIKLTVLREGERREIVLQNK